MQRNRLADETSPYLLQHAHNPVDWHPWNAEALRRARAEDKPILLSIGYSACHWCHVMERESFEDEATAKLMNERFVCIKVDREERPDLDQIYQFVVQLMGRSGGWPLTVFLTPDQRPFFGGTYYPPTPKYGMPSFSQVLVALSDAYRDRKGEVEEQAGELANAILQIGNDAATTTESVTPAHLSRAAAKLGARFDDTNGGFGARPKFPNTMALEVLLLHALTSGDLEAKNRCKHALDAMQAGGIHDQLGGGFHRYSTDERWLVPHFEKMLYDNALLLRLYANASRVFADESYADTAREIVAWLSREMTRDDGLFFAAQDADSEGEEGKFFVWTRDEIVSALDADEAEVACAFWGVTEEGNFAEPGHAPHGASVLFRAKPSPTDRDTLARARAKLFAVRDRRPRPFRDDKVMVSLDALMISALAEASLALDEPSWLTLATKAFERLWSLTANVTTDGVRLARYVRGDRVVGAGFLEDYAYLGCAALDLYEASGDPSLVDRARLLAATISARFRDQARGGFFMAPNDGEPLIVRSKDTFDHAMPSGAASAAILLLRLGTLVDAECARIAEEEIGSWGKAADDPFGHATSVLAVDMLTRGLTEVVIVASTAGELARWRDAIGREVIVHRLLAQVDHSSPSSRAVAVRILEGKGLVGTTVGYVCQQKACSPPFATLSALLAHLGELRKSPE
jgi:uncharacterized protein YyaL (SSP411 family)